MVYVIEVFQRESLYIHYSNSTAVVNGADHMSSMKLYKGLLQLAIL